MRRNILPVLLFASIIINGICLGQEKKNSFFKNGKPIGIVFSNFHTGINQGNNPSAFEIRRAYFGYSMDISENFSAKILLNIGSPDDVSQYSLLRRFAYFKNAYLRYKNKKITVDFGIITLYQFKVQEKIWGHRYIYKMVAQEHNLGSSADLGASVKYCLNDYIEADFTLMNGEGYSKLQADNSYKGGLGISVFPYKGLILRVYVDMINKQLSQTTIMNFIAYTIKDKLTFGVEYDLKYNYLFYENHNRRAFSTYISYNINSHFQIFGRYDIVSSNILSDEDVPWDIAMDGSAIIAGVQYRPIPNIRIALNYQDWYPYAKNEQNLAYIYLNLYYSVW